MLQPLFRTIPFSLNQRLPSPSPFLHPLILISHILYSTHPSQNHPRHQLNTSATYSQTFCLPPHLPPPGDDHVIEKSHTLFSVSSSSTRDSYTKKTSPLPPSTLPPKSMAPTDLKSPYQSQPQTQPRKRNKKPPSGKTANCKENIAEKTLIPLHRYPPHLY